MPNAPKRPCTYPGCRVLVDSGSKGRCGLHRKQDERERSRRRRADPDDQIHFHNSAEWRAIREQHLRSNPFCVKCQADDGLAVPAVVCDHVRSIKDGGDKRDPANLQSLCKHCHDSKTWTEINNRRVGLNIDGK